MTMQKTQLKELKRAYKKARLIPGEGDPADLERQLRELLDESAWVEFAKNVETFIEEAKRLGEEVAQKTRDGSIRVRAALEDYLDRAKSLGGGAQQYIQQVFDKAMAERNAIRAAPPRPSRMNAKHACWNWRRPRRKTLPAASSAKRCRFSWRPESQPAMAGPTTISRWFFPQTSNWTSIPSTPAY